MARAGSSELTAFMAIADQRSFRAAARVLEVTPSALSHAMRTLEARLGVRLFNRTTRSVSLTEQGEQFLRRVRPALSDLDDAVQALTSARDRPSGSIRISCAESGASLLMRHVLPDFLVRYPEIKVEFVVDGRMIDIVADGFDAGIRLLEAVPRDMIAVRFGPDMRMVAVASPAYLARHAEPKAPHDLMQHQCIRFRFDSGTIYRWDLERRGRSANVDVPGQLTTGNTHLMIEAALAGIGIAWVPEDYAAEHVAAGRLRVLLPEWCPRFPGLCLYYPANRHPPVALRLFAQAVRDWTQERPKSASRAKTAKKARAAPRGR